ncbi:MAG: hypothetical protein LBV30_00335 [Propionibacteriaceae bacterium]|jgi:hypothetical protein|nr:hypothetical protein [Propionibacteriaceae bacterium]
MILNEGGDPWRFRNNASITTQIGFIPVVVSVFISVQAVRLQNLRKLLLRKVNRYFYYSVVGLAATFISWMISTWLAKNENSTSVERIWQPFSEWVALGCGAVTLGMVLSTIARMCFLGFRSWNQRRKSRPSIGQEVRMAFAPYTQDSNGKITSPRKLEFAPARTH